MQIEFENTSAGTYPSVIPTLKLCQKAQVISFLLLGLTFLQNTGFTSFIYVSVENLTSVPECSIETSVVLMIALES